MVQLFLLNAVLLTPWTDEARSMSASAFVPPSPFLQSGCQQIADSNQDSQSSSVVFVGRKNALELKGARRVGMGFDAKLWASASDDKIDGDDRDNNNESVRRKEAKSASFSSKSKPNESYKSPAQSKSNTKQGATTKKAQAKESLLDAVTNVDRASSNPDMKESQSEAQPQQIEQPSSLREKQNADEGQGQEENFAYNLPRSGISLADELEANGPDGKERFETALTPIVGVIEDDGFARNEDDEIDDKDGKQKQRHEGVARIDTVSTIGNIGEEPVRWVVSLGESSNSNEGKESYVMIDIPPYSDKLANEIRSFMDPEWNATIASKQNRDDPPKATLDAILLTNQQSIHYDTSPAVYVTRKSDLTKWKKAFPGIQAIMYRLDMPRECREEVTQILDGYGPWGWDESAVDNNDGDAKETNKEKNTAPGCRFVETGIPLTIEEWDEDTKSKVMSEGELPPDDQVGNDSADDDESTIKVANDDTKYSPEAIRQREEKYRILAVYTPGHTFGSVTYIFPKRGICCSGYALPLESSSTSTLDYDDDDEEYDVPRTTYASSTPVPPTGPRLDYQGYLATSASRPRQMSSALSLINNYIDRFRVVLPARGDVVFLDSEVEQRKHELMESVGLYQKIGDIYGRLGIVE